ncbi:MAG TPA: DUF2892 domain-containing protein [Actinomycetota bacterium]
MHASPKYVWRWIRAHRNEGPLDRAIRIAVGIVLAPLGLFVLDGVGGAIGGLVVVGVGTLALITGATGFCLIYVPFGFSTVRDRRPAPSPGRRSYRDVRQDRRSAAGSSIG